MLPVLAVQFHPADLGMSCKLGSLKCFGTKKPSLQLPLSVNIETLLKTVCIPLKKERIDKKPVIIKTVNRTLVVKTSKRKNFEDKNFKTTTAIPFQALESTQAATGRLYSAVLTNRVTPHTDREEPKQSYLQWYIAIAVFVVLLLVLITLLLFCKQLAKVRRERNARERRRSFTADDAGFECEPNLWMKLNSVGYDAKTGKITRGEMYGNADQENPNETS